MKLRALNDFCIGGGKDVAVGDEFEVDEYYGRSLIQRRWAEAVEPPSAPPEPAPDVIETREPEAEHREPRTRRTSR